MFSRIISHGSDLCRLCLAGLSAAVLLVAPAAAQEPARWTAVWATALQAIPQDSALLGGDEAPDLSDRTIRQIVFPSLGGALVRLHISNRYATAPLDVRQASFAKAADGTGALSDPVMPVTFGGKNALLLPPGGETESDPIAINLVGHQPYAVSLYLGPDQRPQAWHRAARQVNFISLAGDHSQDRSAAAYQQSFTKFAWITSLAVADLAAGSVLAIGDSITDGSSSSTGLNRRWPDELSRRLAVDGAGPMAVLNAGIAGNRLLSDSPCFGERLLTRFERAINDHAGIETAIVLIGINDINFAAWQPHGAQDCGFPHRDVAAADLIAGYRRLAEIAHRLNVRLLIGTLTPGTLPADREAIRAAVNDWIRKGDGFDGVVDFDAALRDPTRPGALLAAYDSGDHLHPSDAGYAAMATAVPLNLLSVPAGPQLTVSQTAAPTKIQ